MACLYVGILYTRIYDTYIIYVYIYLNLSAFFMFGCSERSGKLLARLFFSHWNFEILVWLTYESRFSNKIKKLFSLYIVSVGYTWIKFWNRWVEKPIVSMCIMGFRGGYPYYNVIHTHIHVNIIIWYSYNVIMKYLNCY